MLIESSLVLDVVPGMKLCGHFYMYILSFVAFLWNSLRIEGRPGRTVLNRLNIYARDKRHVCRQTEHRHTDTRQGTSLKPQSRRGGLNTQIGRASCRERV